MRRSTLFLSTASLTLLVFAGSARAQEWDDDPPPPPPPFHHHLWGGPPPPPPPRYGFYDHDHDRFRRPSRFDFDDRGPPPPPPPDWRRPYWDHPHWDDDDD